MLVMDFGYCDIVLLVISVVAINPIKFTTDDSVTLILEKNVRILTPSGYFEYFCFSRKMSEIFATID
jgi:hypothetical protein